MNSPTATATQSIYDATPREAAAMMQECIEVGLSPFLKSSPGVGKSSLVRQLCKRNNLKMIDIRTSSSAPEDFNGLPNFVVTENGESRSVFSPFEIFPLEGDPLPDGHDGWCIFFDEFNHATKLVAAATYKVILDRMIGQKLIHPNVVVILAGNLMTDKAFVNALGTALQSRVIHINLVPHVQQWIEDVAIPQNYDSRVIAYIGYSGLTALMDFDPNHNNETFCCPRTWEFMNRLVKGKQFAFDKDTQKFEMDGKLKLYAGTISPDKAMAFISFCKLFDELAKIADIIRDPEKTPLPRSPQATWAAITHMAEHMTADNFDKLATYADRFGAVHRVLFYRTAKARLPEVRQSPRFIAGMVSISNYMHGA